MVAMETMHFFIVQLSLSLRTKILPISGVPMNDMAPMKNCPGGCKVGQISSRGKYEWCFNCSDTYARLLYSSGSNKEKQDNKSEIQKQLGTNRISFYFYYVQFH